jgi:hypothetical protein
MQAVAAELLQQGAIALLRVQHDLQLQQQQNALGVAELARLGQEHISQLRQVEMKTAVDAKVKVATAISAAAHAQEAAFKKTIVKKEEEFENRLQHLISLKEQDQSAALAAMESNLKKDYMSALQNALLDKEKEYALTLDSVAKRIHHAELSIEIEKASVLAGARVNAIEQEIRNYSPSVGQRKLYDHV